MGQALKPPTALVIGAGIGGLTAGALLAKRGFGVDVYEQSAVAGGCASTFRRKGFIFEVGATQVAGLEAGGIHYEIFRELDIPLPEASYCDPACVVYLPHETEPIHVWRDRQRWQAERQRQFPNSEPFWQFLEDLFGRSWGFQQRKPILPPRSLSDWWQLIQAIRWDTLPTFPYTFATVGDAVRGFGLGGDQRLWAFLDLQLKLYSQVSAEETALLYGATTLCLSQAPFGLYHLKGSMQVLSDRLLEALKKYGGRYHAMHRIEKIEVKQPPQVLVRNLRTREAWWQPADEVIANVTVHNLCELLGEQLPKGYHRKVASLPTPAGAFVVYLGVRAEAVPADCPPHLQFLDAYGESRSLFVSVSQAGDGRAPQGYRTIIASEFTDPHLWAEVKDYPALKQFFTDRAVQQLGRFFRLEGNIVHVEAATPRTFARYTQRWLGTVGGVGMRVHTFGLWGFANRLPVPHVWLVGDCTHPGEGTAGVSYSALTTVEHICNGYQ
ncbi:MAG: C-3',4' desaturase CrtD [Pseudanabaenaceae cyanobacterium]